MIIGSNAGHTKNGHGRGAIGILDESICTREINNYFINHLKGQIEVLDLTIDYSSNYLSEAVTKANKQFLDYSISHHLNCSSSNLANGVEVWIYDINDKDLYNKAKNICEEISKLGFRNRGVKESKDLYWLKYTKSKALLIEYLFCSNSNDVSKYDAKKLAHAAAKGLLGSVQSNNTSNIKSPKYKNGNYNSMVQVINTNGSGLNIRADRSVSSKVLGKLKEGQVFEVNYCLNNWFSTYVTGSLGYVSGEYIKLK